MRVCNPYTREFRADAVAAVQKGDRTLRQVAADLEINHWTLRDWYRQAQMAKRAKEKTKVKAAAAPTGETAEQRAERLERDNASSPQARRVAGGGSGDPKESCGAFGGSAQHGLDSYLSEGRGEACVWQSEACRTKSGMTSGTVGQAGNL